MEMQIDTFINSINLRSGLKTASKLATFIADNEVDTSKLKVGDFTKDKETLTLVDENPSPYKYYNLEDDKLKVFSSSSSKLRTLIFDKSIRLKKLYLEINIPDFTLDLSAIETVGIELSLVLRSGSTLTLRLPESYGGVTLAKFKVLIKYDMSAGEVSPATINTNATKINTTEFLYLDNVRFKSETGKTSKIMKFSPQKSMSLSKHFPENQLKSISTVNLSYSGMLNDLYPSLVLEKGDLIENVERHPFIKKTILDLYIKQAPNRVFSLLSSLYYNFTPDGYYKLKVNPETEVNVANVTLESGIEPTLELTGANFVIEDIVLYNSDTKILMSVPAFDDVKVGSKLDFLESVKLTMRPIICSYDSPSPNLNFNLTPYTITE